MCPNTVFFLVFSGAFSRIQTKYGEIRSISPYSVRMRENTDQKKLRIWTLFTLCPEIERLFFVFNMILIPLGGIGGEIFSKVGSLLEELAGTKFLKYLKALKYY